MEKLPSQELENNVPLAENTSDKQTKYIQIKPHEELSIESKGTV